MPFKKGQSGNNKGRPVGADGKLNRAVKDVFAEAFNKLQNHPTSNLGTWAEENPHLFYPLATKLIPTEIAGTISAKIHVVPPPQPPKK